ncbi:unnamed protein product [Discosporangium mesarthrocarpum]
MEGEGRTCISCRVSKVKCDKGLPCSRCLRLNSVCVAQTRGRGRPVQQLKTSEGIARSAEASQLHQKDRHTRSARYGRTQSKYHASRTSTRRPVRRKGTVIPQNCAKLALAQRRKNESREKKEETSPKNSSLNTEPVRVIDDHSQELDDTLLREPLPMVPHQHSDTSPLQQVKPRCGFSTGAVSEVVHHLYRRLLFIGPLIL